MEDYRSDHAVLETHFNSGIPNKAACLIAAGGEFRDHEVAALGRWKAGLVYYRVVTEHVGEGTNFARFAAAVSAACTELAKAPNPRLTNTDCEQIRVAYRAVGML